MKGSFVSSTKNSLGIGKIVEITTGTATIEYFLSIGRRVKKSVPAGTVKRRILCKETRCYVLSNATQSWTAGRIGSRDISDGTYEVTFPNKVARYLPEVDLFVRCQRPIEDPTETLVLRSQETPYFYDRRLAFVRCLVNQRAKSHGLTGLLSSNITLYPHQVEVVRRILEDPIQRYLLADEVGLGKTVEAGIILRQYLLDEPTKSAIVLVPEMLVEQWTVELEEKFNISDFTDRVFIGSVNDLNDQVTHDVSGNLGFLVIDEAHHIASGAHLPKGSPGYQQFEICQKLAHKSKQLLLLSATPVLNNEKDFLGMLHLLDPVTYQLADFEAFRERVTKRQDIGRILLSFKESSPAFVVKTTISRLKTVFPDDGVLKAFLENLLVSLDTPTPDQSKQRQLIRSIRTHLSDTYRLHRRMLRNRRESVSLSQRLDPNTTAADLIEEYDDDERGLRVQDLIDDWRGLALKSLSDVGHENPETSETARLLQRIFSILVLASGSWLGVLEKALLVRLTRVESDEFAKDFHDNDGRILVETPFFAGESELLNEMLAVVRQPVRNLDRLRLLEAILERIKISKTKAVVFTNFESAQKEIVHHLQSVFGVKAISSQDSHRTRLEIEDDREKFEDSTDCFVLVCDASGEEGLNLQFADWIIHFDLPWSPNRLEQRIGRLDRIGRNRGVRTRTLLGPESEDSIYDAWYQMLKQGLGVFEKSIASLQFYIDQKLPELEATLFNDGAAGLLYAIPQVQNEIIAEQIKINEQNALDEIDVLENVAFQYFEELKAYDDQNKPIQQAYEDWLLEVLKFKPRRNNDAHEIKGYEPTEYTLVPIETIKNEFAMAISTTGTYDREIAVRYPGNRIFRIGEPMTQALSRYVQVDDRGQAFALWRHWGQWNEDENMDWAGFRFNYIVEADISMLKRTLNESEVADYSIKSLLRRVDALFPPFVFSNFLDINLREVVDEKLQNILALPYRKKGATRCDYNLNFERMSAIDHLIDPQNWRNICEQARVESETVLRESEQFQKLCRSYAMRAKRELGRRNDQLRLRFTRENVSGANSRVLSDELALEEKLQKVVIRGIAKPQIRPDSIGFIVVSGRPPAL